MDRYRQGQLGLGGRQLDVQRELGQGSLSNQLQDIVNRGKYYDGVGKYYGNMPDVQRELNKGTIANQLEDIRSRAKYYEGMGQYYGSMPSVQREEIGVKYALGKQGLENQALDIGGSNRYRDAMANIGRMQAGTQAADVAARNQIAADVARMNYDLGGRQLTNQMNIASLQYDRVPAYQKAILDLYNTNPQAASAMMGVKPTELDLLRESKRQEEDTAYNTAVMSAAQKALDQYTSDQSWFNPDNESTTSMLDLMGKGLSKEQAARVYAERTIAPLYGRGASPEALQPAPGLRGQGGNTNFGMADFETWKRSQSGK